MTLEELNAKEQDELFMAITKTVIKTAAKELAAKGIGDVSDQSTALMTVACSIIAAQISMMSADNRKYALDQLVYGIIESQIPALNDKYK